MLKLGQKAKCRVTGFTGVITKRVEILYGSPQVYLVGFDNSFRRDGWLEEGQCEAIGEHSLASVTDIPTQPGEQGKC